MSRSSRKNIDELHKLRNETKELKIIIRELEKEIKNFNKEFKATDKKAKKIAAIVKTEDPIEVDDNSCEECHKGKKVLIDLGFRTMVNCTICSMRKIIKNVKT